jgi:DNA-binding NarL/FixJ family response regulator
MNASSESATGSKSSRVLLADDHTLVRAGIRALLEQLPGVEVAGEASDGREVLELISARQPDVVLMDISMPGLDGLQALPRITRDFPQVRVIILSMHPNDEYVLQALKFGASGYLLKRAATAELPAALATVLVGGIYLSREIAGQFRKHFPLEQIARASSPLEQLTSRQREILQLLAEGQTTKAIALILKLSEKTIEYHRGKLMARLNIFDLPGLVRFAMRTGLIAQESCPEAGPQPGPSGGGQAVAERGGGGAAGNPGGEAAWEDARQGSPKVWPQGES